MGAPTGGSVSRLRSVVTAAISAVMSAANRRRRSSRSWIRSTCAARSSPFPANVRLGADCGRERRFRTVMVIGDFHPSSPSTRVGAPTASAPFQRATSRRSDARGGCSHRKYGTSRCAWDGCVEEPYSHISDIVVAEGGGIAWGAVYLVHRLRAVWYCTQVVKSQAVPQCSSSR